MFYLARASIFAGFLLFGSIVHALGNGWSGGLPKGTQVTSVGEKIFINGIPTTMIAVAMDQPIQQAATFFYEQWESEGWTMNLNREGDYIIVSASNRTHQKVATLVKTSNETSEGSLSITDLPRRMLEGIGSEYTVAEHLPKPLNTMVLNEVKILDSTGESIMTTMGNYYDVEQNVAYYKERMFELGWREKKISRPKDKEGVILIFTKPGKEANFTVFRQGKQVFVTVNWLSK